MRLRSRIATVGGLVAVAFVAACHRGSTTQTPAAVEGGEIGDSTAFGVRIIGFNAMRDRATFVLAAPAHVVALAVVPGKTIEPVQRRGADTAMMAAGVHEVAVALPRQTGGPPPQPRLVDQVDYRRCVDQRVRARTRRRTTTKVIRDSTGKAVEIVTTETDEDLGAEREAERACSSILRRAGPEAGVGVAPDGERLLLLIASNVRITETELLERLSAMTVTASDVATTVSAVAEALYFDRRAIWSGYYMRW